MVHVKAFAPMKGSPLPDISGDLAIDPGLNTGWALFSAAEGSWQYPRRLVSCGTGYPPLALAIRVCIELPQAYPHSPVPYQDLITLTFLAGRYAGLATGEVTTVFPHQWKGNLPKDVCGRRVVQHLSKEEYDVLGQCENVVAKGQMHNVLDAVGIGLVVFKKVRL